LEEGHVLRRIESETQRCRVSTAGVYAAHPRLLGIGIDQGAAILVHGDTFKTMDGEVLIHDGKKHAGKAYYILKPGETFNLRTRSVQR
jgi:hypothetical protein